MSAIYLVSEQFEEHLKNYIKHTGRSIKTSLLYLEFALCSRSNSDYNPCLGLLFINCHAKEVSTLLFYLH